MERIYVKYSQLLNSSLSFIFATLEARATPAAFSAPGVSETCKANQERGENTGRQRSEASHLKASESMTSIQRRPLETKG